MNKYVQRIILAILFTAPFFSGCAVNENFKTGQEMVSVKRWEEAVTFFDRASKDEPGNQEYKEALSKAKQEAANVIYEKERQSLVQLTDPNLAALEQIDKNLERARQLDPASNSIAALSRSIQEKISAMRSRLKTLYTQADSDIQLQDWPAAADKLRQINKIFLNYEDTAGRLAKAEQEGAKLLYMQGLSLSKQEDWKMAAQSFKSVMDINPRYYDVAKLYEQARDRDNGDYFISEGDKAVRSQNWDRAIMMYDKAGEYQSDNGELRKKNDSLKAKVGQIYFEESVKLANQGILFKAVARLEAAKSYAPAMSADVQFRDFNSKLCTLLMERANKCAEKDLWGNAYVWLQKADVINPNHPNLFQKQLEARDNINKRIRKSIAVFDFGAPTNNKDAGKIAANKLIAYLHKNASGDLRIIERENLQSILKEMQLGQTGLVDLKAAQTVGKMRGIDTFIMGDVLQYSTTYVDNPSVGQEKVKIDDEQVPNPEYNQWLIVHNYKPTQEESQNAPPKLLKKPIYQLISYKKGIARITAMIEISYKLVDTITGENIYTNTIPGKLIKEDAYQNGVVMANIPDNPLELPTELEVIDELTNARISDVGQSVLKQYQSLEVQYFNDGQLQEKRRNFEAALEKYIDAVFDEKLKGIATALSQKCQVSIQKIIEDK